MNATYKDSSRSVCQPFSRCIPRTFPALDALDVPLVRPCSEALYRSAPFPLRTSSSSTANRSLFTRPIAALDEKGSASVCFPLSPLTDGLNATRFSASRFVLFVPYCDPYIVQHHTHTHTHKKNNIIIIHTCPRALQSHAFKRNFHVDFPLHSL